MRISVCRNEFFGICPKCPFREEPEKHCQYFSPLGYTLIQIQKGEKQCKNPEVGTTANRNVLVEKLLKETFQMFLFSIIGLGICCLALVSQMT
jgi:hypothetical protein